MATVKKTQMEVLERISGFTAEEAKNYLINQLAEEVTHESAMKVREIEAQFKEEADTRAKEILSWPSSAAPPTMWPKPPSLWFPCPMTR